MWMAGNVATLPMFSLVPALLAKNVCLVKLAMPDADGMDRLLAVLADREAEGLRGPELLEAVAVVWFDYRNSRPQRSRCRWRPMPRSSGAARGAIRAITRCRGRNTAWKSSSARSTRSACIGRKRWRTKPAWTAVAAFVRDIAVFDQRACSAPQTIFIERNAGTRSRRSAKCLPGNSPDCRRRPRLDAYTTMRDPQRPGRMGHGRVEGRDRFADGANWTVCMDREVSLKEAVQSRPSF